MDRKSSIKNERQSREAVRAHENPGVFRKLKQQSGRRGGAARQTLSQLMLSFVPYPSSIN